MYRPLWLTTLIPTFFLVTATPASAQESDETPPPGEVLETIEVEANQQPVLGPASLRETRYRVRRTPGGAQAVPVNPGETAKGTLSDVFALEPGVVVQEFFGSNDQPRINIRGSGIQSNPQSRGINFLRDGLPVNLADGSFVAGIIDPEAADHIEVKRGANALADGAATLGGSVDLISPTGRRAPGVSASLGGGSFDTRRFDIRAGGSRGNIDGLVRVGYNESNGFRRRNNDNQRGVLNANAGWKHGSNAETRVYLDLTDLEFDIPGPLNEQQLEADPKQVNRGIQPPPPGPQTGTESVGPNVVRDEPWRNTEAYRAAIMHDRLLMDGVLRIGGFYQQIDDVFGAPSNVRDSQIEDVGLDIDWREDTLRLGMSIQAGRIDRAFKANEFGEAGRKFTDNRMEATNSVLFGEWRPTLSEKATLVVGGQALYSSRDIEEQFDTPGQRPRFNARTDSYTTFSSRRVTLDKEYSAFNPKLGILFRPTDQLTLFGNVSRSYEPPTFIELLASSGSTPDHSPNAVVAAPLDGQEAVTLEVGGRGSTGAADWSATAYYSRLENELLTSDALFGATGVTTNSDARTIHRGVELGGAGALATDLIASGDAVSLEVAYEWSDFFFSEGRFEDNQIAGVPEHRLQMQSRYEHPGGAYLQPSVTWLPEDTATDHANTTFQDAYGLLSLRAGWAADDWELFIEGRNLTDETYASSYLIRNRVPKPGPPNAGREDVTTFIPGSGRSVYVGLRASW